MTGGGQRGGSVPSRKILIIDDEPDCISIYKDRLESGGYTVVSETDPHEARWVIRQECPDLILLDLNMPGMTGFELMTSLNGCVSSRVPILILTANEDDAKRVEAAALGAAGYFVKGRDETRLLDRIRSFLN